jgi:glucose/arabinose dehydrogenase
VNYTNLQNNTVIARYLVSSDPDSADTASGQILLTITQPYANHNGGTLLFGPEGYLYIGMGDGGSEGDPQNRAQDPAELLGKMLRIDVSGDSGYTVPPTNPFVGNPLFRPEIWAWGLRNPYRWSFDRLTGDLWIADVGQDSWEEIDFQPAGDPGGQNYGWRLMEGDHCYNPPANCDNGTLTLPIQEYSHAFGCAIAGGYVYRGQRIPAFQGAYFYADWCSAHIWSIRYDGQTVSDSTDHTVEFAPGGGLSINSPAGFGEDGSGELYIVDRGDGTDGEVYEILPDPADTAAGQPPPARLSVEAISDNPFRGRLSFDVLCDRAGLLRVEAFGIDGRLTREIFASEVGPGTHGLSWDGLDAEGHQAPGGTYFLRVRLGGETSVHRINLVR